MAELNGQKIRQAMLEVVDKCSQERYLQSINILEGTLKKLGLGSASSEDQKAILTVYHDMFRIGLLAWGCDFSNSTPPFCHVTERGRETLKNLSRDPANPDGYLNQAQLNNINEISLSYIKEALQTYNSNCYKASAVMVGGASEALILKLRDILTESSISLTEENRKKLSDWRIKTVLAEIKKVLDNEKTNMPRPLDEKYEAYWPAFTQQIRATRNEAGHPSSIEPVTFDIVHASLLIFPELANLVNELEVWITSYNSNT
jgi:hypothetical protein